jgi:hypothetical protein
MIVAAPPGADPVPAPRLHAAEHAEYPNFIYQEVSMSSYSINVSGARALSSTINSPEATHAQIPSKQEDHASVQIGAFTEMRFLLPLAARLERIEGHTGGSEYLRVVIPPGGGDLTVYARSGEMLVPDPEAKTPGGWGHVWVQAGKHLTDPYAANEVVDVVYGRMGDLIPPTE